MACPKHRMNCIMLCIVHPALFIFIMLMGIPQMPLCELVHGKTLHFNHKHKQILSKLFVNPFGNYDQMDNDETISVVYTRGRVMTDPIQVALLWFGKRWSSNSNQTMRNAISSLTPDKNQTLENTAEVPSLRNWWKIVTQYTDVNGRPATDSVTLGPECFYKGSTRHMTKDKVRKVGHAVFNQTQLDGFGGNLTCTNLFEVDDNTIYHMLISEHVMFEDGDEQIDFTKKCSGTFEKWEIEEGKSITMVWERQPQNGYDQCSSLFSEASYLGPPSGDEKLDTLISFMLAKTADQVINSDGNGWRAQRNNSPLTSLCSSPSGRPYQDPPRPVFNDSQMEVSFNVQGLNGYRYMVQQLWNAKVKNCGLQYSEPYTGTVTLMKPKGRFSTGIIANHTSGLQPYPPNLNCTWKIQIQNAKFIRLNLTYLAVTPNSDFLSFYTTQDDGNGCQISFGGQDCLSNTYSELGDYKLMGSEALVKFSSGNDVSAEAGGWEINYEAGFCDGKEDIYDSLGIITEGSPQGLPYSSNLRCIWVLHGKFGTPVSLNFTQLNISRGLDFIAIYNGTEELMDHQLVNYSGSYLGASLPCVTFMGPILVAFSTQTENGYGWAARFNITSPMPRKRKINKRFIIVIAISVVIQITVLIFVIAAMVLFRKLKMKSHTAAVASTHEQRLEIIPRENKKERNLNLHLQLQLTNENIIGEGSSAVVYRGILPDGRVVAVKKPMKGPNLEADMLSRISHGNVVSMIGYSEDQENSQLGIIVLVFEFMENRSLSHNLHGQGTNQGFILSWALRLRIAVQISLGLQFLHIYSDPRIAHGNLTTDNVLLDSSWNAKLGGFGSAIFCKRGPGSILSDKIPSIAPGYIDPDLLQSGSSVVAADVYSFGVVLLELLSGNKAKDSSFDPPELASWGPNLVQTGQALKLFDSRIEIPRAEKETTALLKMAELAVWCVNANSRTRPTIGDVVTSLQQVLNIFQAPDNRVVTTEQLPGPSAPSLPRNSKQKLDLQC